MSTKDQTIPKLAALQNAGTDLRSLQSNGATRFDVDGDGYREVTEWVGAGDAMLGMDLSTMKLKLADGSQVLASTEQLRAQVLGTQVWVEESTKNPIVAVEQHDGKRRKGCQMRCKSALKAGAARVVRCGNLRETRVADFREMAM